MGASYGGLESWKTRRVKDWSEYDACNDEACGAKAGEPCMSPKRKAGSWGGRRKRVTAHPLRPRKTLLYPEHAKLAKLADRMDVIFEWTTFLSLKGQAVPDGATYGRLVDEFFGIDREKLTLESKEMWKVANR